MRTIKLVAAGAAALCALGAGAASASAFTLGPAGTAVSGSGYAGGSIPGFKFGYTGAGTLTVNCSSTKESGTLNGGASVRLASTFANCRAEGSLSGPATVTATNGMLLSVTHSQTYDGKLSYFGQLTTGAGLVFTVGSCTLRVPSGIELVGEPNTNRLSLTNGSAGTRVILGFDYRTENQLHPFTGSAGCPEFLRGSKTVGFGAHHFDLGTFKGMNVS